jgi:hypothetical protein
MTITCYWRLTWRRDCHPGSDMFVDSLWRRAELGYVGPSQSDHLGLMYSRYSGPKNRVEGLETVLAI